MNPIASHRYELAQSTSACATNINHPPSRSGMLARLLTSASLRWKRNRMISAFNAMDDHVLRDIGIHRTQIEQFVDSLSTRELDMAPLAQTPPKVSEPWDQAA
ncbi:DUF1127 domain-containing protein [Gymnodinialimonas sp. 57CJ19]|uniref:DUF1127 domain-containing protein n=1 Tax=Gymnodinialimonas sp. 57CJ19 TaxID=3138498 RepID=UPI00313462FB